jgi:lysophospholipase L1-like esterase
MVEMQSEAERIGIRLVVVLIPTRERVYANFLKQAGHVDKNLRLADALRQEDAARDMIVGSLRQGRIEFVDALPALEAAVVDRDVYPLTDPHPNKAGYRVIAETINHHLSR